MRKGKGACTAIAFDIDTQVAEARDGCFLEVIVYGMIERGLAAHGFRPHAGSLFFWR